MPVFRGTSEIVDIRRGADPIVKRYRGADLIWERGGAPSSITETWTGTNGTGWPAQWDITDPTGGDITDTIQSNRGRLTAFNGDYTLALATLLDSDHTDVDITFTVIPGQTTESYIEAYWRMGATVTIGGFPGFPGNTYALDVQPEIDQVNLQYVDGTGGATNLATVNTAGVGVTTALRFHIKVEGNNHKARWWDDGDTEPSTWQIDEDDSTLTSGLFALALYSGVGTASRQADWDDLTLTFPTVTPPTGLWKGVGTVRDLEVANPGVTAHDVNLLNVSWYYDWANYSHIDGFPDQVPTPGVVYVPIMWGDWENETRFDLGGPPSEGVGPSAVLLGFNEPDIEDQSDVSVARALELWPQLEATGARLGSPAAGGDSGSQPWLADFMNGDGLGYVPHVDFICAHWYPEYDSGFPDLGDFLDYLHTTYGLPIWLTEVGSLEGTVDENEALIATVIDILIDRPWVERVAWYHARASGPTHADTSLVDPATGNLNDAGTAYAAYPRKIAGAATVPEAPTALNATAGDTEVDLAWSAGADGGSAITDYTVQWRSTTPLLVPTETSGRFVLDQDGVPYLFPSMSSWGMAQNLTNTQITEALEGLAAVGFKAVTVALFGNFYGGDWERYENIGGEAFFTGDPMESDLGPAWDSTITHMMNEAERLGMTVLTSLYTGAGGTWGTDGMGDDWVAAEASTPGSARTLGQDIATFLAPWNNRIWHFGADKNIDADSALALVIDQFFRGVLDVEGSDHKLILAEPYSGGDTYIEFTDNEGTSPTGYQWMHLDIAGSYHYDGETVEMFESVWGSGTMPTWDAEPPYVGADRYSTGNYRQQVRERNWSTFIEGGCGINYGDESWWSFGKPGTFTGGGVDWMTRLTAAETIDASYCWAQVDRYCRDLTWHPSAFVVTGMGSGDTKAASGNSDTVALAYFPSSRTIAVDTTVIGGTGNVRVRWYDPTLPWDDPDSYTEVAASEAQNASRSVTHPGANDSGQNDWVLIVDGGTDPTPPAPGGWNTFSDGVSTTPATTVTGLTNDIEYEFRVAATNAIGTGAYSATDTATPTGTPPVVLEVVAATATASAGAGVRDIAAPTGGQDGDYLVECFFMNPSGTAPSDLAISGFSSNPISSQTDGSITQAAQWFWKPWVSGDDGATFSVVGSGSGDWSEALMWLIRGLPEDWEPDTPAIQIETTAGEVQVLPWVADADSITLLAYKDYSPVEPTTEPPSPWVQDAHASSHTGYHRSFATQTSVDGLTVGSDNGLSAVALLHSAAPLPPFTDITPIHHAHGVSDASVNALSVDVADWAVEAGDLLVVLCGAELGDTFSASPDTNFDISGGGLTWTLAKADSGEPFNGRFQAATAIFYAFATSTTTITDITAVTTLATLVMAYDAIRYQGVDDTDPIGVTGGQFHPDSAGGAFGQYDTTLSGAPAETSYVLGVCYVNTTDTNGDKNLLHGVDDGFTELADTGADQNASGKWGLMSTQHRTGWTTARITWDDVKPPPATWDTYSLAISAVEIKAGSA